MFDHPIIGIDLGGTNIKFGLVRSGKILRRSISKTRPEHGVETAIDKIKRSVEKLSENMDIEGIGIGAAGLVDHKSGTIRVPPNLPGWNNVPLRSLIEEKTGIPTFVCNDVNAAALGEFYFGAGRGRREIFCINLGTGVGGAVISRGTLLLGYNDAAGEVGHTIVDPAGPPCRCGQRGCLERFVGAEYITSETRERLLQENSLIRSLVHSDLSRITPKTISIAANRGDALAKEIIRMVGYYVGLAIVNVIHLVDPEIIIVGGGIAGAGRILISAIQETVRKGIMKFEGRKLDICLSTLGGDAGILGASCFVEIAETLL